LTVRDRSIYSMIDSGSNAIYFSELFFADFIKALFDYIGSDDYTMVDGIINSDCHDFPPLFFQFDEYWIKVDPSDYVLDRSEAQDRSVCMLMVFPNSTPFHVIGSPALIGYYTIHEMEKGRIGFAPHKDSKKPKLEKGEKPKKVFLGVSASQQEGDAVPDLNKENVSGASNALLLSIFIAMTFFLFLSGIGVCLIWEPIKKNVKNGTTRWVLVLLYIVLVAVICALIVQPTFYEILSVSTTED